MSVNFNADAKHGITLADFWAYLPDHCYIFTPTSAFWTMSGVNACLPPIPVIGADGKPALNKNGEPKKVPATVWLDRHQAVHHLTWAPGHPKLIKDHLVVEGGWIKREKVITFNLYRPPTIKHGESTKAEPWLELVRKVYPSDWPRIINFAAHRVQRPGEKINHGLVLGGAPGIGKDTIFEPVKRAVGAWNFKEVSPQQLMGRFTGFLQAVILRVSEVRDLGDFNRYQLYEHAKTYLATPPDVLRVDEKNTPEHEVVNCCGVIFTTNHLTDGIFLPADDRRHDVMWSELTRDDFESGYWNQIWQWYDAGGDTHVAAYLAKLDISKFDPEVPPPKTAAFWAIVDSNRAPEEGELTDVLDKLGNPKAVTLEQVKSALDYMSDFHHWLDDRKNRRAIPHRFEKCGYVPVRNEARGTGLWVDCEGVRQATRETWDIIRVRQVVYAKSELTVRDRFKAVEELQSKKAKEADDAKTAAEKKAADEKAAREKAAGGRERTARFSGSEGSGSSGRSYFLP